MRKPFFALAALLSACAAAPVANDQATPPAPPSQAEEAELNRIEAECLTSPQMPGWDCGFGGLEDARSWEAEHRRRSVRR